MRSWILTAAQQRAMDDASVRAGTSAERLMESAGTHAAAWILDHLRPESVVVLGGPGGNGGDAWVAVRVLVQAGVAVRAFALKGIDASAPLTREMAQRLGAPDVPIYTASDVGPALDEAMRAADCVIDGLFGSGLSRPLAGEPFDLVERVLRCPARIVSLDLPSGLASDTGRMPGIAIRAAVTLAMGFFKPAHWLYPAASSCGDVHLMGVDYPEDIVESTIPAATVPRGEEIGALLPKRVPDGHKGTFGHVLAVAGSQGMTGAAVLCVRGALRAGAGLVTVAIPASIAPAIQAAVPEALTVPLPDRDGRLIDAGVAEALEPAMGHADVLAIGPGLSRDPEAMAAVRHIVQRFEGKLVIDADGLHAFVRHADLLRSLSSRAVLTPHPGELAALVDAAAQEIDADRMQHARAFVEQGYPTLVLKGRPSIIASEGRPLCFNPTGNSGLATGGSGDVLTGLLAGLIAGGCETSDAAIAAAYIHGLAADRWAMEFSERSLMPSDLLDALPRLLKELES